MWGNDKSGSGCYPARICASGVKQSVLSIVVVVVVCRCLQIKLNIFITADLEVKLFLNRRLTMKSVIY